MNIVSAVSWTDIPTEVMATSMICNQDSVRICSLAVTLWKKPFCFSFPPENSRIKDRKSRRRYQNNLPAANRVFFNCPCQKSYGRKIPAGKSRPENPGRKIPAGNNTYGRKIPAFWCQKRQGQKIPASYYRYGRKIRLPVTANTAGKSRQVATWYGRKIRLPVTADTAGKSRQVTSRYGRKIRLPVTTETAGKSWQSAHKCNNFRETMVQWRSGRVSAL